MGRLIYKAAGIVGTTRVCSFDFTECVRSGLFVPRLFQSCLPLVWIFLSYLSSFLANREQSETRQPVSGQNSSGVFCRSSIRRQSGLLEDLSAHALPSRMLVMESSSRRLTDSSSTSADLPGNLRTRSHSSSLHHFLSAYLGAADRSSGRLVGGTCSRLSCGASSLTELPDVLSATAAVLELQAPIVRC